jgi:hypothetical protein
MGTRTRTCIITAALLACLPWSQAAQGASAGDGYRAHLANVHEALFKVAATGSAADFANLFDEYGDDLVAEIDAPLDADAKRTTPLMAAAWANADADLVRGMISRGASVDAKDANGWTALLYAAQNGRSPEVVAALLEGGASIDYRDKRGRTALMIALKYNKNRGIAIQLAKRGASLTAKDDSGMSVRDYEITYGISLQDG